MGRFLELCGLGLRPVLEGAAQGLGLAVGDGATNAAADWFVSRFNDHSARLAEALGRAHERAWGALEFALGGHTLWQKCAGMFARAEDKAFRGQLQAFLDSVSSDLPQLPDDFRRSCLRELQAARKDREFELGPLDLRRIAREAGRFAAFADPIKILEAERRAVASVATELPAGRFPNLSTLLGMAPPKGAPILAAAVRYFVRCEISADERLSRELADAKITLISERQDSGFSALGEALRAHGDDLNRALADLAGVVIETRDDVREIKEGVRRLLERRQLSGRELRSGDSLSIRDESERRLVGELLRRFRSLPEGQRRSAELLNDLGKALVAVGDFEEARRDFSAAAALPCDAGFRAEALHNEYLAAMELGDHAAAMPPLLSAIRLDPQRFEPFDTANYRIERILGAGGFGTTFLCRDMAGGDVVMKSLRADGLELGVNEIFGEAKALRTLSHPDIIRLQTCGLHRGRPYLLMDYFDGLTLQQYVAQRGPITADDMVPLATKIVGALAAAHGRNVLHRDVKPANILVSRAAEGWAVRLIDFGLSLRPADLASSAGSSEHLQKTAFGRDIAGTLDYAAPEQLGRLPGEKVGPRSDLYGFGRTCCFAMFGTPIPRRFHWSKVPDSWGELLDGCIAESPAERPKDAGDLLNRLAKLAAPAAPVITRPPAPVVASTPPQSRSQIAPAVSATFVPIKAGEFVMGDPGIEDSRLHRVRITKTFHMGATLVTQAQYRTIMGENPSHLKGDENTLPVENVSWADAKRFCEKLGATRSETKAGRTYRLPTEAEWEYACRAGTTTNYWYGDEADPEKMNCENKFKATTPVEQFPANPWGLHDMHGNLWQWCADAYDEHFYGKCPQDDPFNAEGFARVIRGGSWAAGRAHCRSGYRVRRAPRNSDGGIGFRIVCMAEAESPTPPSEVSAVVPPSRPLESLAAAPKASPAPEVSPAPLVPRADADDRQTVKAVPTWHMLRGGQRFGPFTVADLQIRVADGRLQPNDRLWRDGMANWIAAATVPEFFPQTAAPALSLLDDFRASAVPTRRPMPAKSRTVPFWEDTQENQLLRLFTRAMAVFMAFAGLICLVASANSISTGGGACSGFGILLSVGFIAASWFFATRSPSK